jgi:hypothetical protein
VPEREQIELGKGLPKRSQDLTRKIGSRMILGGAPNGTIRRKHQRRDGCSAAELLAPAGFSQRKNKMSPITAIIVAAGIIWAIFWLAHPPSFKRVKRIESTRRHSNERDPASTRHETAKSVSSIKARQESRALIWPIKQRHRGAKPLGPRR